MNEDLKNQIQAVIEGEAEIAEDELLLAFTECFQAIERDSAPKEREEECYVFRLFFSSQIHAQLLHKNLPNALRAFHVSLLCVKAENGTCSTTFFMFTFKLLSLIICFQGMESLQQTVDFCVERQAIFKELVARGRATMTFLFTFNVLAKRLVGQEFLLGRLRKFCSFCLGMDTRSNFNIGASLNTAIQTIPRKEDLDENQKINEPLYDKLWKVVSVCQNPKLLLSTASTGMKWKDFKKDLNEILDALKVQPIDLKTAKVTCRVLIEDLKEHFVFPKYVTSTRLFRYQLNDPSFRRHILLQIGICLIGHYQLSKCHQHANRQRNPLLRNLTRVDHKWTGKTFETIVELLEATPVFIKNEQGNFVHDAKRSKDLAISYRDILLREFHYVHWKHDRKTKKKACPTLVLPKQQIPEKKVFHDPNTKDYGKFVPLGSSELSKLWENQGNDLHSLKMENLPGRTATDYLEENIERLIEDETDEFLQDEPQLKRRHDAKFSFHTLRLILRERPFQLARLNQTWEEGLQGNGITNPMYHLLAEEDPEQGKVAFAEIERAMKKKKVVSESTKAHPKPPPPNPPKKVEDKKSKPEKKRSLTAEDSEARRKRRKIDLKGVSLDDLS